MASALVAIATLVGPNDYPIEHHTVDLIDVLYREGSAHNYVCFWNGNATPGSLESRGWHVLGQNDAGPYPIGNGCRYEYIAADGTLMVIHAKGRSTTWSKWDSQLDHVNAGGKSRPLRR